MKILSADIGWKNLAFVVFEVLENDKFKIIEWKLVDLLDNESIPNINKATLDDLIKIATPTINTVVEVWQSYEPSIIYLENQPLGPMARNTKTKTLSHIFQVLLLSKQLEVKFVSPTLKLRGMEKKKGSSYTENKKFAIESCKHLLQEDETNQVWKDWFVSYAGKKDDLADAFLQGYFAYFNVKKKPTKKQTT